MQQTEKEYLINYGYVEKCDSCLDQAIPIHKFDAYLEKDHENFIVFNGKKFICRECIGLIYGN